MDINGLHKISCLGELKKPLYYSHETGMVYRWYHYNYFYGRGKSNLKPITATDSNGYYHVKVNNKARKVHQIVAQEFLGYQQPGATSGLVINHKNGNKKDNRKENLEIVTNAENVRHSIHSRKSNDLPPNVTWSKIHNKYVVRVVFGKDYPSFGCYINLEHAAQAAKRAQEYQASNTQLTDIDDPIFTARRFNTKV